MGESRYSGFSINLFSLIRAALLVIIGAAIFVVFIGLPLFVSGQSMEPNFESRELVFVEKLSYANDGEIRRFDVVAAKFPADPDKTRLIKRVIGLPGETVRVSNGTFTINGVPLTEPYSITLGEIPYTELEEVQLRAGEYFLAGDNRPGSSDSRLWGAVQRSDILGRVWAILLPVDKARVLVR
jgi:signal peptidase I